MNVSGNVCADAIVSNVNGNDVVKFSVASNRRYKTKNGETKEEVTFMYCVLWGKKDAAKVLFKGRAVNVTGYFNVRNYVGNDGVLKTFFSLSVASFEAFGKGRAEAPAVASDNEIKTDLPDQEQPPFADPIADLPF